MGTPISYSLRSVPNGVPKDQRSQRKLLNVKIR